MKTLFQSTVVGSVLLGTAAAACAGCLMFDGVNDYVEFNRPVSGDFTVECWFRSTQLSGSDAQWYQGTGLVDGKVNGVANDFGLTLGNGKVLFGTGNPDTTIRSTAALNDGHWHHVAATRQKASGTLKLFVDGLLNATGTGSTADLTAPVKLRLGSLATGLNFFQGDLDEVRVWNVARADIEIAGSLNRRLTGNEPGLVAYYPMEEGTGTTTADMSGHGLTGSLFNGVVWNIIEDAVAPAALTGPAALLTGSNASLNGWINTNSLPTSSYFQWWSGTTTNETPHQVVAGSNSVLSLGGFNDYVLVPTNLWFTNDFTIETWVFERSYNNWSRVIDFGNGAPMDNVILALNAGTSGQPNFTVYRGSTAQGLTIPYSVPLNQWVHLAATLAGGTATVYINGAAVASGPVWAPNLVNRLNDYIGRSNWAGDGYANALFDDLRIWNVARTADQIRRFMTQPVASNDPNLVLNYLFDAPSGNGTLTNGASLLASIPISTAVSNLLPGTIYSFRAVAETTNGISLGNVERLATPLPGGGTALEFDGTNDFVAVPDAPSLDLTTSLTFEAWVEFRQVTRTTGGYDWQCLFAKSAYSSSYALMLCTGGADKTLRFYHAGASPAQSDYAWRDVTTNRWYHVAATLGGGAAKLYIDGVLKASNSVSGTITANALPLQLGYSSVGPYPFDGQMDEVRLWRQARAESDIRLGLNERLTGAEPGLVAYYRMDEGAGRTLVDATTNANDGLVLSGPLWVPSTAPVGIPIATTQRATYLARDRVLVNGIANPAGSNNFAWFEWGTSTNYGQTTASTSVDSTAPEVAVSAELSGLILGTVYHYRLAVSNNVGFAFGADATFVITAASSLADSGPGSLRQALADAQPGAILLLTNAGTITLTNGELLINKDLTLVGLGATNLAIGGYSRSRVFNIASNVTVSISGLTIRDGRAGNGLDGAYDGYAGGAGNAGGGVYNAGILTLQDCILTNNAAGNGGAGHVGAYTGGVGGAGGNGGGGGGGGAIYNDTSGVLTLERCTVAGNFSGPGGGAGAGGEGKSHSGWAGAGSDGGPGGAGGAGGAGAGICSLGSLTLNAGLIASNLCGSGSWGGTGGKGGNSGDFWYGRWGGGGGPGGRGGNGGAVYASGGASLVNCTLSGNSDGAGGNGGSGGEKGYGGWGDGGNGGPGNGGDGGSGGGLYTAGFLQLSSCTIVYNRSGAAGLGGTWPLSGAAGAAGRGAGVINQASAQSAQMANTIVALNLNSASSPDDAFGAYLSVGGNLIGNANGSTGFSGASGDLLNVPPLLAPLADNGGPTRTHALWPESPAINAGTNLTVGLTTDQRGFPRVGCAGIDIGAFEYEGCPFLLQPAAKRALYFDGLDDYVQGGTVVLANTSFTIEAWAKRALIGTSDCILGQGTATTDHGLFFGFLPNNTFCFAFYSDDLNTAAAYTDTDWHHWAGTYDTNSHVRLIYRDGVLVASNTASVYLGSGALRIGAVPWGVAPFDGEIDEVRVWNVARTAEEISLNLSRTVSPDEPGLVAYYRFDEGNGTQTHDEKGSMLANLVNGPFWVLSSAPLWKPIVVTLPAESVRSTEATLEGAVTPLGTNITRCWFEYGTSRDLGNQSDVRYLYPALLASNVWFEVTNLMSGTRYYFRLVADNRGASTNDNLAGTVYGDIVQFDTLVVGSGYPISTRANDGQNSTAPRHITDAEGNVYLAGLFSGSISFGKSQSLAASGSSTNAFLAMLARKGDWRWAASIPVSTDGQVQIEGLALDQQTNVLAVGTFSGTATFGTNSLISASGTRAFLARFEPAATNWTWAMALGAGTNNSANAVAVGSDGHFFVAGQFSGNTSFGTNIYGTNATLSALGSSDAFVAGFDAARRLQWAIQAGSAGATNEAAATAVAVGPLGDVYAAGSFMGRGSFGVISLTNAGVSDLFLASLNPTNGLIQWATRAGGAGGDKGTALAVDPAGSVYLVAQLSGAADFNGAPLPELDRSGMNLVVAQLSRQGVLSRYAAARAAYADSIAIAAPGQVYLLGDFVGLMQYGPNLTPVGSGTNSSSDVFLARLVAGTNTLDWADFKQIGGIGTETRGCVSVDPSGSVAVSGTYSQTLHIGYVELSTPNAQEIFVARLDPDGTYEHNRWEIGQAIIPPDQALASVPESRAKGLLSIEILAAPAGLTDSDEGNSFLWNNEEMKLYAVRPVTARLKWRLDENVTNLVNVATMVGRCFWPDHPQTDVSGVPVEVQGPGLGQGYYFAGILFNTNGAEIFPITRSGAQQFQIFQTATNASGYNVLHYTTQPGAGKSVLEVVYSRPYVAGAFGETVEVEAGKALTRGEHQDSTGKNGYVFFERSFYDGAAHDRTNRIGPIIPVNRNLRNDPNRELVVVWYRTNEVTGVAWGSDPVHYTVNWPADATKLVIAAAQGAPIDNTLYPQASVYQQSDANAPGFNPNEEHALLLGGQLFALRCDLNNTINPQASEPYVLLKYLGPGGTNDWRMRVFAVVAEDATHTFANFTSGVAGLEIQAPEPLSLLPQCASSNRIAFGQAQGHQAWNGKLFAKSAGYLQVQYWYPTQPDFYFGVSNPPVGACVPWMSQYAQTTVTPGTNHVLGEPVLVGYSISWPSDAPELAFAQTLTQPTHGLPDLLHFASARVIYDDGDPQAANWTNSLVRIYDPLSERTVQLAETFKLPAGIATATDRGRLVFMDLPYPLRIRLFYDDLNHRLSFGGWYDPNFGTGEPLLLPNILSPRERDRILRLADNADPGPQIAAFTNAICRLYDLTRNPNQVDAEPKDGEADTELRVGLITQIRDGYNEILMGPVILGPETNFVTWRTNLLAEPVNPRVTNVIQEPFGDLPKALTAGLRPGSGYVTVVENDDPSLPGQPITLHVLYVTNWPFVGDLKVLPSDNVFDQRLTLRHSSDFGGEPQNYEFEWYYQPDQNGVSPPLPVLAPGQTNWNGWIRFPTPPSGTDNGYNDLTLGEGDTLSDLLILCDNWVLCRYRGFTNGVPTQWSDWVGAPGGNAGMLAEGWIKRVIAGLNEFDSRTKDFHTAEAATYASMILQAGPRYEGPVAFNPDPNYLNSIGLVEAYETVLDRGRKLSIDAAPPVNFGPANDALLRAAGKIADLYVLLGNEAYADASDPTIGFTTSSGEYGNLAPSIFCFQNQLDSPLEEELALLRGRDDSAMTVRAAPVYNRLVWNFTQGEGEVAYKLTYNISDQNGDGFIDEKDARILYPQGHGDAWGHYLTALTKYYELLRDPYYEWVPRPEAVTVGGSPVQVDYLDERKFAQAAAAKAKTGAEIVNLTYRQKYVEDPAGQWQGYKDTQTDRAWGVSEWAARAGTGAYFDWVVANAILPATDPDTNHVGIQKIDRTTVTDLTEIPAQFAAIEAQLDTVDRGLNPLGLAAGAMPFDIDPSKVTAGQTHFDQIYNRALKAMANTLALFDHVNSLSQSLRRNQDDVDHFNQNVQDQERDYRNRMIEIFGYPYAGDLGPAGTYPSGYDGPDIYHYMYVNASDLTGNQTEPDQVITGYYQPLQFPGISTAGMPSFYFPDDVKDLTVPGPAEDGTFHVHFPMVENGAYQFAAPAAWGSRRAPGKIQEALGEMLKARAQLNQGLIAYDDLRNEILDELQLLQAQVDMDSFQIAARTREVVEVGILSLVELFTAKSKEAVEQAGEKIKDATQTATTALPTEVGLSTDAFSTLRGTLHALGAIGWQGLKAVGAVLGMAEKQDENAKLVIESQTELAIECASTKYEILERVKAIEQLCREEAAKRVELYSLQEDVEQAFGAYLSVLAEGQRLEEERYNFRVKTAAQVEEYRYQDMAFRVFQNDALQKYRAQFDLAARYVYLAAKAYDYETCLLNTDTGAGIRLLTDIVRQRTLGELVNGLPVSGRQGLADPLARLGQNFEVYRGQLGFSTPETETGRFSLRSELFRVRPGDLETNALNSLVSTNQDWRALLQQCRVPDLWQVPEFRRFCRPFAPESAGPQPGLVIRIPTTVTFGLNYFGWPLGPGDSAYDSSRFATKVRSAGVWFSGYNLAGLSMTPRVYLVPAGTDVLRSPSSYNLETREFNVVDQKLPVPFPIGASDLGNPSWIPVNDSLSEAFGDIRRFSSFRAYHDRGYFDETEATQDTRLIGRSVWNTEWLLIIPGGTFLYDPNRGLDTFIATIGDIKIFFQTYSYSGD